MREVICGPFHSGHREQWTEQIRNDVQAGQGQGADKFLYLVPTRGLAGVVRDLILQGLPGLAGERILTLFEVVEEVLRQSGGAYMRLDALMAERLAAKVMRRLDLTWHGEPLEKWSHSPGVVAAFRQHIGELKRAMVTPEQLTQQAGRIGTAATDGDAENLRVLAAVYAAYQQELHAGEHIKLDTEETYLEAARLLNARGLDGFFPRVERVYIDYFTDFQPHQMAVVMPLLQAGGVQVYLPYQPDRWAWLESLADGMNGTIRQFRSEKLAVRFHSDEASVDLAEDLRFFQKRLFAPHPDLLLKPDAFLMERESEGESQKQGDGADVTSGGSDGSDTSLERATAKEPATLASAPSVTVFNARTAEKEWLWAAKRIKELHSQGVPLHDIAILTNREFKYGSPAYRVFKREGIPVDQPVTLAADQVPWLRDLLTLYTLEDAVWHRDTVQQLASAAWLFGDHPLEGKETLPMRAAKQFGIVKGLWEWRNRLGRAEERMKQKMLTSLEGMDNFSGMSGAGSDATPIPHDPHTLSLPDIQALISWLNLLHAKTTDIPATATGREHVEALRRILPGANLYDRLVAMFRTEKGYTLDYLQRDLRARDNLEQVLQDLEKMEHLLGESDTYTRSEFADLLRLHLAAQDITVERGQRGGVAFLNPSAARGMSFAHVFFIGLNEGEWPAPPRTPWLLRESIREDLQQKVALQAPQAQLDMEKLFFLMGLHTARQGVWLSHVGGSKQDLPSRFLDELYSLCPSLKHEAEQDDYLGGSSLFPTRREQISNKREALDWLASQLAEASAATDDFLSMEAYLLLEPDYWQQILHQAESEHQRAARAGDTRYDGVLADPDIHTQLADRYSQEQVYSVSQFNRYGECGYKFFLSRVLKLDTEQEEEAELSALEKGSLYHTVLQRLHKHLADDPEQTITSDKIDFLRAQLPQIFEAEWARVQGPRRTEVALRQLLEKDRMFRRLRDWFEAEAQAWLGQTLPLVPRHLEWSFGLPLHDESDPHSQAEPVKVGPLKFRGQIDRIDITRDGKFMVVDYKTRSTKPMPKALENGLDFQLPVYLKAAQQALFQDKGEPVGAAYFSIEKADRTTSALIREEYHNDLGMGKKRKITDEQWEHLMQHTEQTLEHYRSQMASGHFPVLPNDENLCQYCDYKRICRYDRLRAMSRETADTESKQHARQEQHTAAAQAAAAAPHHDPSQGNGGE